MRLNKRGGEKIFSLWWFVSLAFVGASVTMVIMIYFGAFIDVRDKEVSMFQEKIMDCISKNGILNSEVLEWELEDFTSKCSINSLQLSDKSPYFFNLTIYREDGKEVKFFVLGDISSQQDCIVGLSGKAKYFPKCVISKEPILYFNETTAKKESWQVYLLVSSNNHGEKIPITEKK